MGMRIARSGMIVSYILLPASPHDSQLLDDLLAGYEGILLGDKGFVDRQRHRDLPLRRNILLLTPYRRNMAASPYATAARQTRRWRKRIETINSHLTERFCLPQVRAHDVWHYFHGLVRQLLAHTICVFLNLILGRAPLDLDDLARPV